MTNHHDALHVILFDRLGHVGLDRAEHHAPASYSHQSCGVCRRVATMVALGNLWALGRSVGRSKLHALCIKSSVMAQNLHIDALLTISLPAGMSATPKEVIAMRRVVAASSISSTFSLCCTALH